MSAILAGTGGDRYPAGGLRTAVVVAPGERHAPVTVPGRSRSTIPCEVNHKEDTMRVVTASSPARAIQDHHADRRERGRSWILALVEALAYAGASIDPASALAAQRFARIRDEALRRDRSHS
jgi:hypothetical protein